MPPRSCWWALVLLVFTATASAQSAASAVLSPPQTDSFPRLRTYLDVHDELGGFVHGLQASQVRIQENGRSLPVVELEELRPGLQVVFVINPGESFTIRDGQGNSRYESIRKALVDWARSRLGSTLDDLSLMAGGGPERTHFPDSQALITDLESYQPDPLGSTPGIDILLRAIDVAADIPPRPGMERAVLFVTGPPTGDITIGLQEIISRATQLRVQVYVWFVASAQAFSGTAALGLSGLAAQTGGEFLAFSGVETLPGLESYFEPLRDIYTLGYDSQISAGGPQQLAAEIVLDGETIATDPVSFDFNLLPPEPVFISPSAEVIRAVPPERIRDFWEQSGSEALYPQEQPLQILVDFLDGRPRPLSRSLLYVDGLLVEEHTQAPFEFFSWDLTAYTTSGQHLIQVEVFDSLGMRGASMLLPVQIRVDLPRPSLTSSLLVHWPALAGLALTLAAAVVFLALIISGRIQPRLVAPLRLRRVVKRVPALIGAERPAGDGSGRHLPDWINRLHWPQRRLNPKAYAFLFLLSDGGERPTESPISLAVDELTFGLDPSLATIVLDDPSVEGLHARLLRQPEGAFRLVDEGSVAGTWVNYQPVPEDGILLEHGDLIHFGRKGFRFALREPLQTRKLVITYVESQP